MEPRRKKKPRPPFSAYDGDRSYVFASYAHADCVAVYDELEHLNRCGLPVWYDEGITPGGEWPDHIARALENCALFLVFMTPESVASPNVRNEINYALDRGKRVVAVHLEPTELSPGLRLRLGDIQAIFKHGTDTSLYRKQLARALALIQESDSQPPSDLDSSDDDRDDDRSDLDFGKLGF